MGLALKSQSFVVGFDILKKVECEGASNGSIKAKPINVSGSFISYTYKWENNETTQTLSNLVPGFYKVTVTGIRIAQPYTVVKTGICYLQYTPKIAFTTNVTKTCGYNMDGSVKINSSGGKAPYKYNWRIVTPVGDDYIGTTNPAIVPHGTFSFTITDDDGCLRVGSTYVGMRPGIVPKPDIDNVKCNGDSTGNISLTISPFGVYKYLWSNGKNTPNLTNIPAGNYKATLTAISGEAAGCAITTDEYIVKQETKLLINTFSISDASCFDKSDGHIASYGSGGKPPFSYLWNNGITTSSNLNIPSGTYSVTLTDSYGCKESKSYTIAAPPEFKVKLVKIDHRNGNSGGNIDVTNTNGFTPIGYTWNDSNLNIVGTHEDIFNQKAGKYRISMRDSKNCGATQTYEILQFTAIDKTLLEKIRAFYSYSDQKVHIKYNDQIEISNISLYNLQGNQIMNISYPHRDQELDLAHLPMGIYVLQLETELGHASIKINKIDINY